jgi:hypothetical protein
MSWAMQRYQQAQSTISSVEKHNGCLADQRLIIINFNRETRSPGKKQAYSEWLDLHPPFVPMTGPTVTILLEVLLDLNKDWVFAFVGDENNKDTINTQLPEQIKKAVQNNLPGAQEVLFRVVSPVEVMRVYPNPLEDLMYSRPTTTAAVPELKRPPLREGCMCLSCAAAREAQKVSSIPGTDDLPALDIDVEGESVQENAW